MRVLAYIAAAMLASGVIVIGLWFMLGQRSHPPSEWKVIANEPNSVIVENKAMRGDTIIRGTCGASPGIRFTILDYQGNAFVIVDGSNRPFRFDSLRRPLFLMVKHGAVSKEYINSAHYFGPTVGAEVVRANSESKAVASTWDVVEPLNSNFMALLAESDTLLIQNQFRQTVAEFSAAGANGAYQTMQRICWRTNK
jgi:hypothetical protein